MRLLVTGAAGFIGKTVAARLTSVSEITAVRLVDRVMPDLPADSRFEARCGDLSSPEEVLAALDGIDMVIHLASIPGGSAESNPGLSRRVNLDATLAMLEVLDSRTTSSRFVYASSIAVFGSMTAPVDDETIPHPSLVYGTHKRMVEMALTDFHRRGKVRGIALRLPGIVARPGDGAGLKSAFMSEIFHAARAGKPFTLPVGPEATMWLMSARQVADNLIHAALLPEVEGQALSLPALRVTAQDLANALYGGAQDRVRFVPDLALQANFGALPPLFAAAAQVLGFRDDGTLEQLIEATLA